MLWGPNSASPIHGHGGSQCSMALLSGDLVETRYRPFVATAVSERALPLGHVTRIHDEVSFHKLSSVSGATSLHLYSTPLLSMQTFDEQQSQWVSKTVSELN
jgi:cysteine dioxygenase